MCFVFKKWNRKAVKKYSKEIPRQFNKKDIEDNLKTEINQLKIFNNKYIVKYYDDFIEDNYIYVVLEYCEACEIILILIK